jgi:AcrR family transcriptional regulator
MPSKNTVRPAAPSETERRLPTQERAQRTVETLFSATAQIVETEGAQALTTNKIAAKAGFSIGTLYQYFPSKEAIVQAMVERAREHLMQLLDQLLTQAQTEQADPRDVLRDYMRIMVLHLGTGRSDLVMAAVPRRLRGAMVRLAWQMDDYEHSSKAVREFAERIALYLNHAAQTHPQLNLRCPPARLFVIMRAVLGVIRSASLEKSPLLGTPEFEAELVHMVFAVLSTEPLPSSLPANP